MHWLTRLLCEVLKIAAGISLFFVGLLCFLAVAIFVRPVLMFGLMAGAIACVLLSVFSPRVRAWLDAPNSLPTTRCR